MSAAGRPRLPTCLLLLGIGGLASAQGPSSIRMEERVQVTLKAQQAFVEYAFSLDQVGYVIPKFEAVASSLQIGEVSEPFKTQFGWHIVQVMDRREFDNTEEMRRATARQQIRERKLDEEGQAWLAQIRDTAYVEYRLEEE